MNRLEMDWIKIEERLPEANVECLVTVRKVIEDDIYYKTDKLKYDSEEGWMYENWDDNYFVGWCSFCERYNEEKDKVIAWMPYPESYKEN